jgi:malate dehydrogenase (quinone)
VFGFDYDSLSSYATILADRVLLPYVLRNLLYDLPAIGKRAFLPHVQKVVPTATVEDIERAKGYGGVRPQIVDTANRSLDMGEATIEGENVVFNITPSPGASTCLKNARRDATTALSFLDGEYTFDDAAFEAATIDQFPRGD